MGAARPLRVGLTGGIASGKSAVSRAFERRGIEVVDADVATRELTRPGAAALAEIAARLGAGTIAPDGGLDRAAVRARVFADPAERRALEAILHPRVAQWLRERAERAQGPYVVLAIPLLAEVGRYDWLDAVVVVDCPPELQRERLIRRDRIDAALANAMIAAQASRATRLALADYVIENTGSEAELDARVGAIDRALRERHGSAL